MAILDNKSLLDGARGRIGNYVLRRMNGKTILCKRAVKRAKLTDRQLALQQKFSLAVKYANQHMKNVELKAFYSTGINKKKRSAYTVAMSDYMNPPKIEHIDPSQYNGAIGAPIYIHATDDFKVISVTVEIENSEGEVIEIGNASFDPSLTKFWVYRSTRINTLLKGSKIIVSGTDFARNVTTRTLVLSNIVDGALR